jgi:hypothetical protein
MPFFRGRKATQGERGGCGKGGHRLHLYVEWGGKENKFEWARYVTAGTGVEMAVKMRRGEDLNRARF